MKTQSTLITTPVTDMSRCRTITSSNNANMYPEYALNANTAYAPAPFVPTAFVPFSNERRLPINEQVLTVLVPKGLQFTDADELIVNDDACRLTVSCGARGQSVRIGAVVDKPNSVRIAAEVSVLAHGQLQITPLAVNRDVLRLLYTFTDDRHTRRVARHLAGLAKAVAMNSRAATVHMYRHRARLAELLPALGAALEPEWTTCTALGPVTALRTVTAVPEPDTSEVVWLTKGVTVVDADDHLVEPTSDRALLALQQVRTAITGQRILVDVETGEVCMGLRRWRTAVRVDDAALLERLDSSDFEPTLLRRVGTQWAFIPPYAPMYGPALEQLRRQYRAVTELIGGDVERDDPFATLAIRTTFVSNTAAGVVATRWVPSNYV